MTAIRELLGKPAEAPAAVPTSVHEDNRAMGEYQPLDLDSIPTSSAKQPEDRRVGCAGVLSPDIWLVATGEESHIRFAELFTPVEP